MRPQQNAQQNARQHSLRTQLFVSHLLPMGLMLLALVGAVAGFSRLGRSVDHILRDNYQSVVAAQDMKEALERIDDAAATSLAGQSAEAHREYAQFRPQFEAAYHTEATNITEPGEQQVVDNLGREWTLYRSDLERMLGVTPPLTTEAVRRAFYFGTLRREFTQIKRGAQDVLDLNQAAIIRADEPRRALARHRFRLAAALCHRDRWRSYRRSAHRRLPASSALYMVRARLRRPADPQYGVRKLMRLSLLLSRSLPLPAVALLMGALAPLAHGQAGGGAPGSAGSATTGTTGAASQAAPASPGASVSANSAAQPQSSAAAYAGTAAPGADPRKPPPAKPGALTLRDVVDLARARNPTLLAAEANLRSTRALEIQAGVRANPYIGVAASNVTLAANGSQANPYSYAVQVSRLFERGNKRQYRLQDARASTTQTQAQLSDSIRQTVLSVKQAFTHMLIAKAALDLSRANIADFRREVEIASDRYKAGDIGKLDFERIDLQLGSFEADQANSEIALLQASDQLQTLLGVATPSPDFDIAGEIIPPLVMQTKEELTQAAITSRPDYAAARAGVAVAEAATRLAVANSTTDPTLEGEYDRSGTYNSAGFNINFPVRLFDRNQGNIVSAQLAAEATRQTEAAARNQVVSDVDQAWIGYTRARALSDRFGQHYLDESSDVLSIARFAYDHGGLALIDYLDALREARSSTSDALNAYSQTWLAIHQLSAASTIEITP